MKRPNGNDIKIVKDEINEEDGEQTN